jgi:hypothetical protein
MKTNRTSKIRTSASIIIFLLLSGLSAIQTIAYSQDTDKDERSLLDSEIFSYNDIFSCREGRAFSSVEIWKKTGNRPNGWLSLRSNSSHPLPIVLSDKYKSLLANLEEVVLNKNSTNDSKQVLRVELSENKETFLSKLTANLDFNPMRTEFIVELTVEERLAFYELSKAWAETNIKEVYPDYQLPLEIDVIPLKYLIFNSVKTRTAERKFRYDDVFASNEVDIKAEPVGGIDRFLRNVALNTGSEITLNPTDYPEKIEFEFLINSSGNISMVNLVTAIAEDNIKEKQLFSLMKQLNDNLIKVSSLYRWKAAIKDNEKVSSRVRIQIPKTLL